MSGVMCYSASVRSPEQRDGGVTKEQPYGFNYRQVSHDLIACSYAPAIRLGLPSRLMIYDFPS